MTSRLKNGRFVKKKTADKINKALESMAREKKSKAENTLQDTDGGEIPDENGIVTWKVMAKNLKCTNCRSLLDLEKLFDFKTEGLNSHFKIKCDKCTRLNLVNTGVKKNAVSEINSSVILGKLILYSNV